MKLSDSTEDSKVQPDASDGTEEVVHLRGIEMQRPFTPEVQSKE